MNGDSDWLDIWKQYHVILKQINVSICTPVFREWTLHQQQQQMIVWLNIDSSLEQQ